MSRKRSVEIDKPEDYTLAIKNISAPVFIKTMDDDVGAILTDPSTDTTEVYVLPKGFKNYLPIVCWPFASLSMLS